MAAAEQSEQVLSSSNNSIVVCKRCKIPPQIDRYDQGDIREWIDIQCPTCTHYAGGDADNVIEKWQEMNKVSES